MLENFSGSVARDLIQVRRRRPATTPARNLRALDLLTVLAVYTRFRQLLYSTTLTVSQRARWRDVMTKIKSAYIPLLNIQNEEVKGFK